MTYHELITRLNAGQAETTKSLSVYFGVSVRTIQTYLRQLQEQFPQCLRLEKGRITLLQQLPLQAGSCIPANSGERRSYILRKLLTQPKPLPLDELAAALCISEITLQKEIKAIRRSLSGEELLLKTKNGCLFLAGTAEAKKALIIKLVYDEAQNAMVSTTTLAAIFPQYDIEGIRGCILQKLNEKEFFIDEYSLINLMLHLLIAMEQRGVHPNGRSYEPAGDTVELNRHFVLIVDSICTELESCYGLHFSRGSKYQFALLLMTRAIRGRNSPFAQNASLSISPETMTLTTDIADAVQSDYDIDLHDIDFFIPFSLHLKNLLLRLRQGVVVHNPLLSSIKATSPLIYDIAVYVSDLICKQEDVSMSEDEIAYIALHIGTRIEAMKSKEGKLNAALVCPQYYSYDHRQFEQLASYFSDDMVLDAILTSPDEAAGFKCDLLLSTVPLPSVTGVVLISNFFTATDKQVISARIRQIKLSREKERMLILLRHLIREEMFDPHATYTTRQSALLGMSSALQAAGYVTPEYADRVLRREEVSPTNFGMIAIPHPVDHYSEFTVLEVAILERPIPWGSGSIRIIFMFSISRQDLPVFADVFSYLAKVCSEPANLEKLIAAKSYDKFIDLLTNFYTE